MICVNHQARDDGDWGMISLLVFYNLCALFLPGNLFPHLPNICVCHVIVSVLDQMHLLFYFSYAW